MKSRLASLLIAVSLAGCGQTPLPGDWFFCLNSGCTDFDAEGLRFDTEDQVFELLAPGDQYEVGQETYCLAGQLGTYSVDGDQLTIIPNQGPAEVSEIESNGSVVALRMGGNELVTLIKQVDGSDYSGPCE